MMTNSYCTLTPQIAGNGTGRSTLPGRALYGGNRSTYESRDQTEFRLTPREQEVLALLCAGLPNKLVGRRLGISGHTVKTHVAAILRQLGVASRVQAVVFAYRYRLLGDKKTA
jgi:DNA-binding CsgD family transcriptional regulator